MQTANALRVFVLIPVKVLSQSKSRWVGVPTSDRRAGLLAMLSSVVDAAAGALGYDSCTIITNDIIIQQAAEDMGVVWTPDPGTDLNSTIELAARKAFGEGADGVMYLPADVAAATASDVHEVVNASEHCTRPVAVPAERDGGTNALLMPASASLPPLLGINSFERHRRVADRLGTPLVMVKASGLIMDVDTADTFAWIRTNLSGFECKLKTWKRWLSERNG